MKEYKGDKRKKEYKEYVKARHKEKFGLGDAIEKATEKLGVKKVVEKLTPDGKDCGCEARKDVANYFTLSTKTLDVVIPEGFNSSEEYIRYVNNKIKPRWKLITPFTEDLLNDYCELKSEMEKGNLPKQKDSMELINKYIKHLFKTFYSTNISCCLENHLSDVDRVYETYL